MRSSIFGEQSLSSATQEWIKVQFTLRAGHAKLSMFTLWNWETTILEKFVRRIDNTLIDFRTLVRTTASSEKDQLKKLNRGKKILTWLGNVNNKMWA